MKRAAVCLPFPRGAFLFLGTTLADSALRSESRAPLYVNGAGPTDVVAEVVEVTAVVDVIEPGGRAMPLAGRRPPSVED
jgi:hypothetical protein